MNFNYNDWGEIETTQINLLGIDEVPICPLISIDKDTVKFEHNLQDYDSLEFEIKKYVNDDNGEAVIAQGYDNIHLLSKIVLPKLGKFIVSSEPEISYSDGMEKKVVSCKSLEYELSFKDIKEFKINTGETSSYERLYSENIDAFGHTINFIQFYNPDDSRYSLLDIICNQLDGNWKVGRVDKLLQTKKYYFDVENQDIYSFLMQDVSNAFKCIFQFNTINRTINAYLGENLGEDTGVIIGYRNLLSSTDITQATDEIYTKFTVVGSDDLDIAQVNFGESQIEDLSYFMNERFLSKDLIKKYNNWIKVREKKRTEYVNKIKEFISNQESRDNIINLVPLDSLEYDWDTFSKDELDREQAYFEDLVKAIEKEFTDESGNLDMNALKNSIYWLDYQSYTEWIIPNIKIAKENLLLPDDDKKDYLDGWKYDWKLYGTNELKVMMETFDNQMQSAKGYEKAWSELTKDEQKKYINQTTYDTIHEQYAKAKEHYDGASAQYDKLTKEVNTYQAKMDSAQTEMNTIATSVNIKNSDFGFTEHELKVLSMLYIESDYENENFLVTTIMTQVDKIDEELKLLDEAKTELSERSRPQYSFSCNLDNLFNLPEFKSWHSEVEVGNFIRLETTESHQEKLRITSISFNPCKRDNDLSINFANMIISRGIRSDLSTLFDTSYSSSKNSISYGSSDSKDSDNNYDDLLKFILNSRKFNDKISSANLDSIVASDAQIKNAVIDYAKIDEINAVVSNVVVETVNLEFVKNLIAGHITAEDIFATNTTTDFMTIGTDKNGNKIQINANTIQFVKADGTVYIQLGIDGENNVSFIMRNKNGDILISPDGITQDAVPDGLIVDNMIKRKDTNYSGISKDALNIDSVVEGINDNGNLSVSSSNVYFDDKTQTLNTVLTEMQESVHAVEGKMLYTVSIDSSNGTSISDLQETTLTAVIYDIGTLNEAVGTFTYQWYKNGNLVENQANNTYTIHGSDFTNGAKYICKVSYKNGSTTGSIIISKTGKDITVSPNAPSNPQNGDLWYDSENKLLKCYDETTSEWIADKSEDVYKELKSNYYTKTETNDKVTSIVGQDTQILDPDGNPVTLKTIYTKSEQTAKGFEWLVSGDGDKTDFAITNEGISSIVSNETFKDGVDDSINNSTVITSFKQDFDGFKTTVSETYVDKTEFNNMSVGSTNLLLATKNFGKISTSNGDWSMSTDDDGFTVASRTGNGNWIELQTITTIDAKDNPQAGNTLVLALDAKADDLETSPLNYTLALKVYGSNDGFKTWQSSVYTECYIDGSSSRYLKVLSGTRQNDKWCRLSYIVTIPATFNSGSLGTYNEYRYGMGVYVTKHNTGHTLSVRKFKMSFGNVPSDWSPAPEDYETRISSAESKIEQNADSIEATVKKDGVISAINQTAEEITIDANKVNLNGYLTVTNTRIGGTNLLLATKNFGNISTSNGDWSMTTGIDNFGVASRTGNGNWNAIRLITNIDATDNAQADKQVVISLDAKADDLATSPKNYLVAWEIYGSNDGFKTWQRQKYTNCYIDGSSGNSNYYLAGTRQNNKWCTLSFTLTLDKLTAGSWGTYNEYRYGVAVYTTNNNTGHTISVQKIKMEYGSVATSWSPAPEDISVENIYKDGTTTIDGGKITTGSIDGDKITANSITTKQLDAENIFSNTANINTIFSQDITATGTITGATLKGATAEIEGGSIGGWSLANNRIYSLAGQFEAAPSIYSENTVKEDPDFAGNYITSVYNIGSVDGEIGYALYDDSVLYGLCSYQKRNAHYEEDYNSYTGYIGAATVISDHGVGILCDNRSDGLILKEWDYKKQEVVGYWVKLSPGRFVMSGNNKITIVSPGSVVTTDGLEENGTYITNTSISTDGTLTVKGESTFNALVTNKVAKDNYAYYAADNTTRAVYLGVSEGNNAGIYDATNSQWIIKSDTSKNVTLMGKTVNIEVSETPKPTAFKPYLCKSNQQGFEIATAGYVTGNSTNICFFVPCSRYVVGNPTPSAYSVNGFIIRQSGKYTHGSSSTAYVKPSSYSVSLTPGGFNIVAVMSSTSNAINNAPCGIRWSGVVALN